MFLINFQLWARNPKIFGGGNFNIRGDLIIVSDYSSRSLVAWKKSWPCLKPLRARLLKARTRPLRGPLKLAEVGMTYGAGLLTGAPLQCFGVWMSKGWILCMSVACTLAFLAEAAFFTSGRLFQLVARCFDSWLGVRFLRLAQKGSGTTLPAAATFQFSFCQCKSMADLKTP